MSYTEEQLRAAGFVSRKLRLRREADADLVAVAADLGLGLSDTVATLAADARKGRKTRASKKSTG